jgi:peptidoglycan/LPS O-acetylase OafA/YrhL
MFNTGNSGVDIFFVLSGFVMVVSTWKKKISILGFFRRRFVRIFPLYFVLTLTYSAIAVLAPPLIPNFNVNLIYFLSSLTFTTAIFGYEAPILGQGWTLEYEMLFYLLFSLSLIFTSFFKKIIFITSLVFLGVLLGVSALFFEFIFGMLAAYFYKKQRLTNLQATFCFVLGLLFLASTSLNLSPNIDRTLIYGIPSFMLVLGLSSMRQNNNGILRKLGDSSYSTYLSQFFVIPFIFKFDGLIQNLVSNSTIMVFGVSVATLIFGHLVHLLVEMPLTKFTRRYVVPH